MDPLQDAVLKFYAHNLVEAEEMEKIKDYFMAVDKDGDGIITLEEIQEVMEHLGKRDEAEKVFEAMNHKKDKKNISYQDFIEALIDRKRLKSEENIKRCFEAIDVKKNGQLSMKEVLNVVFTSKNNKGIEDFEETFKKYSKGKDYVRLTSFRIKTF